MDNQATKRQRAARQLDQSRPRAQAKSQGGGQGGHSKSHGSYNQPQHQPNRLQGDLNEGASIGQHAIFPLEQSRSSSKARGQSSSYSRPRATQTAAGGHGQAKQSTTAQEALQNVIDDHRHNKMDFQPGSPSQPANTGIAYSESDAQTAVNGVEDAGDMQGVEDSEESGAGGHAQDSEVPGKSEDQALSQRDYDDDSGFFDHDTMVDSSTASESSRVTADHQQYVNPFQVAQQAFEVAQKMMEHDGLLQREKARLEEALRAEQARSQRELEAAKATYKDRLDAKDKAKATAESARDAALSAKAEAEGQKKLYETMLEKEKDATAAAQKERDHYKIMAEKPTVRVRRAALYLARRGKAKARNIIANHKRDFGATQTNATAAMPGLAHNFSDATTGVANNTPSVADNTPSGAGTSQSVAEAILSVADTTQGATDTIRSIADTTLNIAGPTPSVADATPSAAGTTRSVADATRSVVDATRSVAGATQSVADTTQSNADTAPIIANATQSVDTTMPGVVAATSSVALTMPGIAVAMPSFETTSQVPAVMPNVGTITQTSLGKRQREVTQEDDDDERQTSKLKLENDQVPIGIAGNQAPDIDELQDGSSLPQAQDSAALTNPDVGSGPIIEADALEDSPVEESSPPNKYLAACYASLSATDASCTYEDLVANKKLPAPTAVLARTAPILGRTRVTKSAKQFGAGTSQYEYKRQGSLRSVISNPPVYTRFAPTSSRVGKAWSELPKVDSSLLKSPKHHILSPSTPSRTNKLSRYDTALPKGVSTSTRDMDRYRQLLVEVKESQSSRLAWWRDACKV